MSDENEILFANVDRSNSYNLGHDLYPFGGAKADGGEFAPGEEGEDNAVDWKCWVADMTFKPAPFIQKAMVERYSSEKPWGYTYQPTKMWQAVATHLETKSGWKKGSLQPSHFLYSPSVVTSCYFSIMAFTKPGDAVICMTPLYPPLLELVEDTGRKLVKFQLAQDDLSIDFAKLESTVIENQCHHMILCNPHNPGGRVWTRDELLRIAKVADSHDVLVLSDEIHCDLILRIDDDKELRASDDSQLNKKRKKESEYKSPPPFVPFSSVCSSPSRCVTFAAPTKTWNLAGLKTSFIVIQDKELWQKFHKAYYCSHASFGGVTATTVLEACYSQTDPEPWAWVLACRRHLINQIDLIAQWLARTKIPIRMVRPKSSFLVWFDCREFPGPQSPAHFFINQARVGIVPGSVFGDARFDCYIRLNIAMDRPTLEQILTRLEETFVAVHGRPSQ